MGEETQPTDTAYSIVRKAIIERGVIVIFGAFAAVAMELYHLESGQQSLRDQVGNIPQIVEGALLRDSNTRLTEELRQAREALQRSNSIHEETQKLVMPPTTRGGGR